MGESTIFGVSARGILAFVVTISCCALAIWVKDIGVLKDLGFLVLGSYFSRQSGQQGNTSTSVSTPDVSIISSSGDLKKPSDGVAHVQT